MSGRWLVSEAGDRSGECSAFRARETRSAVGAGPAIRQLFGLFERHLKNPAAELVAVECSNCYQCVLVVGHCHETITLALGRREVSHHLHAISSEHDTTNEKRSIISCRPPVGEAGI